MNRAKDRRRSSSRSSVKEDCVCRSSESLVHWRNFFRDGNGGKTCSLCRAGAAQILNSLMSMERRTLSQIRRN